MTSQSMVPRVKDMCRDRRVEVFGLDDGLVPENDDFALGRVRICRMSEAGGRRVSCSMYRTRT